MSYIINIYQKDTRTRSGKRLCGSYEYELEEKEDMDRKVRELHALYKASDGYIIKVSRPK